MYFIIISFVIATTNLDKVAERKRLDCGDHTITAGGSNVVSYFWEDGGTFEVDLDSSFPCKILCFLVGNLSCQNLLLALGLAHMLNTDMDTLLQNTSIYLLIDTDSDSSLSHIKDNSGTSVVVLVGHTSVDGGIGKNVNVVTNLHLHEVLGHMNGSMLPVLLGKHVARTRPGSE
jgi:hypothetical protein